MDTTDRKLRAILWRQWKRNWTRAKELIRRGLTHERHAQPTLRAFADAELAVDGQATFDGELEISLAGVVEEYLVLGSSASDAAS